MNSVFKLSLGTAAALLLSPAVWFVPGMAVNGLKKYDDDCDYLMILGCNILGEDTPCSQLAERIDRAAEYLNAHPMTVAVPCGGCFRKGQKVSEAEVIRRYLTDKGIDESRILLEDKSKTTYENFEFALRIISEDAEKSIEKIKVAFLTSDYHIFRSSLIAKQSGLKKPYKVSAPTHGKSCKSYMREFFVSYDFLFRTFFMNKK